MAQDTDSTDEIFHLTAVLAGISGTEWKRLSQRIPPWPDRQRLLRRLLIRSRLSPTIIFCFGDQVLMQYRDVLSFESGSLCARGSGERIKGKNEIVDPSESLSAESLRSIFVKIETLVFKCVHLGLEGQSLRYHPRSETHEARLERLGSRKALTKEEKNIGMDLYDTRCQFAHSIASIAEISYVSLPLRDRWGSNGVTRARVLKKWFLWDAFLFSEALLRIFKPMQAQQLDGEIFRAELIAALN